MEPFNKIKQCRRGMMIFNMYDIYVGRSMELYGEFSEAEIALFEQIVKPGMVVLDIGANFGCHTVYFAKAVGPNGFVLAFEPQRLVHQALCGNMSLNSITNAYCLQIALADAPGQIVVPVLDLSKPNNIGGLSIEGHQQGDHVEVRTLDSLNLGACHFIKLDVEGMEQRVLAGATQTIARHRPIMYVENDREDKSAELIRFVNSLGYDMYAHYPPLFNPNNFLGNPTNVWGNVVSVNMLCIPREMKQNLSNFEKIVVP